MNDIMKGFRLVEKSSIPDFLDAYRNLETGEFFHSIGVAKEKLRPIFKQRIVRVKPNVELKKETIQYFLDNIEGQEQPATLDGL